VYRLEGPVEEGVEVFVLGDLERVLFHVDVERVDKVLNLACLDLIHLFSSVLACLD
jgi:hypothetical protein